MEKELYRLIYNSRNAIDGTDEEVAAEVAGIVRRSQRNNQANDLTGALLHSGRCFAQVLEGPLPAIESVYQKISRDLRHTGLGLLELAPIERRMDELHSMMFLDVDGDGSAAAVTANMLEPSHLTGAKVLNLIRRSARADDRMCPPGAIG